jgi:CubicO group peptidase (beta-lactamase class C family)
VAHGAVGVRKFGDTTPVTINDQWLLSSCTKAMTATVVAMLIEQGKFTWTTTMAEIYPELKDRMLPKYRGVTIIELLSHHAGLSDNTTPPGTDLAYWYGLTGPITQQRYEFTKDFLCQPESPEVDALPKPGATYLYSNAGYVILGAVAEKITGKSWENLITTLLFQPLGMTTAGFGAMGTDNQVDQPRLHSYADNQVNPISVEDALHLAGLSPVLWPCGGVHVSLEDWAKFVTMHLEGEKGGSQLLKPETFKILHTPPFDASGQGYALGWIVQSNPWTDGMVLTHNGSILVNYAEVWILQGSDLAVLVTTNIGPPYCGSACREVIQALFSKYLKAK